MPSSCRPSRLRHIILFLKIIKMAWSKDFRWLCVILLVFGKQLTYTNDCCWKLLLFVIMLLFRNSNRPINHQSVDFCFPLKHANYKWLAAAPRWKFTCRTVWSDNDTGCNFIWEGNVWPELQHHSAFSVVSPRSRLLISLDPSVSFRTYIRKGGGGTGGKLLLPRHHKLSWTIEGPSHFVCP